jgi:hypothetical protein
MLASKLSNVRFCFLLTALALFSFGFFSAAVEAQSQSDNTSVADAARRARAQRKNAAKPARTLTNDDLPAAPAATAQPATPATSPSEAADDDQAKSESETSTPGKTPASGEAAPASDSAKKKGEIEAALKRAKGDLAQAQNVLDLLQRKAALDSDSFYAQSDYAHDTDGKARLDANAQQVNDKKSQVEDLKAKVAALLAQLGDSAEPEKPAQPL